MNLIAEQFIKQTTMLLSRFCCTMPTKVTRATAVAVGIFAWQAWREEKLRLKDCIDRVYYRMKCKPHVDIELIVKRCFVHYALTIYEMLKFPKLDNNLIANSKVEFINEHYLKDAWREGRGVILALPHLGNWELFGAAIAQAGYPINSFYLSQKEDALGGLLDYFRSFSKIKLHERDRGAIKAFKALKNGELLGMVADQDGGNNGVYLNFLGHYVSMPAGPAVWSIKTNAKVVPIYSLRDGLKEKFTCEFMPALPDIEHGSYEEKIKLRTRHLADWMEKLILKHPEQYLWFYDRFKPRHHRYLASTRSDKGYPYHGEVRFAQK